MKIDEVIKRINELSKKSKIEELSVDEKEEQQKLRRIYIDSVKDDLRSQLQKVKPNK